MKFTSFEFIKINNKMKAAHQKTVQCFREPNVVLCVRFYLVCSLFSSVIFCVFFFPDSCISSDSLWLFFRCCYFCNCFWWCCVFSIYLSLACMYGKVCVCPTFVLTRWLFTVTVSLFLVPLALRWFQWFRVYTTEYTEYKVFYV